MSRFMKILQDKFTGQQRADRFEFGSIECSIVEQNSEISRQLGTQQEYLFKFIWQNRFFCRAKDLVKARENVVKQFKHDLFGEFNQWILQARQAVFEGDREKLMSLLDKLEDGL